MAIKTYEQAVADGNVWEWDESGSQVAKADRFNQNTQFLVEQDVALNNAIGVVSNGLDSLSQSLQNAVNTLNQTISASQTSNTDAINTAVQSLEASMATIQQSIDNLDAMYATDADIVTKIQQINDAWTNADTTVQQALTALINARYTKDEVDNLLAGKADKATTYTKSETYAKTEADTLLSGKLDKTANAVSATKLATARNIAGVSFDGTENIAIPFANLSSKPTSISGYGITDAYSKSEVDTKVQGIIGMAPASLDTLKEIADQIIADEGAVASLTAIVANKADSSAVYTKEQVDSAISAKIASLTFDQIGA